METLASRKQPTITVELLITEFMLEALISVFGEGYRFFGGVALNF